MQCGSGAKGSIGKHKLWNRKLYGVLKISSNFDHQNRDDYTLKKRKMLSCSHSGVLLQQKYKTMEYAAIKN